MRYPFDRKREENKQIGNDLNEKDMAVLMVIANKIEQDLELLFAVEDGNRTPLFFAERLARGFSKEVEDRKHYTEVMQEAENDLGMKGVRRDCSIT